MITLNRYANFDLLIKSLLPELTNCIKNCLQENNNCSLAIAGGNTPIPLYRELSKENLPWKNIIFTLTDERWVEADTDDSNEYMIKQQLFSNLKEQPGFISLKNNSVSASEGVHDVDLLLNRTLPFLDFVVLGMGLDGHFASIFPGVKNLDSLLTTNNKCLAVSPSGKLDRISLTFSYLTSAKAIYLVVTGDDKKKVIEGVLEGKKIYEGYPIMHLLIQKVCPVYIYWNA